MAGPVPRGKLWRRFGRYLEVYIPPKSFILAHKLMAGRVKDREDTKALLRSLRITKREQAQKIVDKYITSKDMQESEGIQKTLDDFFGPKQ